MKSLSKFITEASSTSKKWFNNRKQWDNARDTLDAYDDDTNTSKDEKGKLIAMWYDDRNEGWVIQ